MPPAKIPHDPLSHRIIHLTYRLKDSVPRDILNILQQRRKLALDRLEATLVDLPEVLRVKEWNKQSYRIEVKYELEIDHATHHIEGGPRYLQQSALANIVIDSWINLRDKQVVLPYAICVMSNHVHVVLCATGSEELDMGKLMKSHKGYTGRMCNRHLEPTGMSFWEDVYFDRRVRDGKFMRTMWYVLNNPVNAGLIKNWFDWPHTYLAPEVKEMFTGFVEE